MIFPVVLKNGKKQSVSEEDTLTVLRSPPNRFIPLNGQMAGSALTEIKYDATLGQI